MYCSLVMILACLLLLWCSNGLQLTAIYTGRKLTYSLAADIGTWLLNFTYQRCLSL